MADQSQREFNAAFVERFFKRRPDQRAAYEDSLMNATATAQNEATIGTGISPVDAMLEAIVLEQRPVLYIRKDWIDHENVTLLGAEAVELVDKLAAAEAKLKPLMPLVGRVDVTGYPVAIDYVGTGWFVADDIVVTNRHVATLIARRDGAKWTFTRGLGNKPIDVAFNTLHEFDDLVADETRRFDIDSVVYIEPDSSPNDIAFLKIRRRTDGSLPGFLQVAAVDASENLPVVTVGYPAKAGRDVIADQALMTQLYRDQYKVKRAAPGLIMQGQNQMTLHDCTTLGGASGAAVFDLASGNVVGLHFAGISKKANLAMPSSVLSRYINNQTWRNAPINETRADAPQADRTVIHPTPVRQATALPPASVSQDVTVTIPLTIHVSLGQPVLPGQMQVAVGAAQLPPADVESAVKQFWDSKPNGVVGTRVGFIDDGDTIGDRPCIAASVPSSRLASVATAGPAQFMGMPVRYYPANVSEQLDALPRSESVDSIAYDDNARKGSKFSFAQINEDMTVQLCVGPEYSWDVLHTFLADARQTLVSAIYEFHAPQIADTLEQRLDAGASLSLVMDNATFSKIKDTAEEFDRIPTFQGWADRFGDKFKRIVAPEGKAGLISDSYHIKVTVKDGETFWLSSGNWKKESSQPVITQEQRDEATEIDLPGNREWHVVIKNDTLASVFSNHIRQDFKRSEELGGNILPKSKMKEETIEIPLEESVVLERRPPSAIIEPTTFTRKFKVRPLLTPDREGAIYSDAVLDLIQSAKSSLLFQIPYIGMPSNPRDDRGYIDELIKLLTQKLKTLDDARVILRVGGAKYSDPTHAAWYFKSKGVDISERVRRIQNHHTKGMIVDGKRVLIGSHNWSKPGVTLNRDASLIFDDADVADYFTRAFNIDWRRSNPIRPKRYVKQEAVMVEGAPIAFVPSYYVTNAYELSSED